MTIIDWLRRSSIHDPDNTPSEDTDPSARGEHPEEGAEPPAEWSASLYEMDRNVSFVRDRAACDVLQAAKDWWLAGDDVVWVPTITSENGRRVVASGRVAFIDVPRRLVFVKDGPQEMYPREVFTYEYGMGHFLA